MLEEKERTANYKPVFVTEITDDLHFYVQDVETGTETGLRSPRSLLPHALPCRSHPPTSPAMSFSCFKGHRWGWGAHPWTPSLARHRLRIPHHLPAMPSWPCMGPHPESTQLPGTPHRPQAPRGCGSGGQVKL